MSSENEVTAATPIGLTNVEARRRLAEIGPNAVADEAAPPWRAFLAKFWAPIPWMLEAAILLQVGLGEYVEATVIGALLAFNAALGFVQEGRAGATLAALKKNLAPTALARRDGAWIRLPAAELVPGDTIRLSLGSVVPADAAVVSGWVMLDQAMLTGESVPVDIGPRGKAYAGSLVRRGQAIAEVTATGSRTYFGRTAELVRLAHVASTEQGAVFGVVRNLAAVNGAIAVLIVIYAQTLGLAYLDLVRLGLTALLATIPVALPATFTLSAALGAQMLARHGVLLTRLSAAHEAAAMDLLCSDKTGTLTRNALEVDEVAPMPGLDRAQVLALAALASSEADQDPIDETIRRAAARSAHDDSTAHVVRFVPFDPATRISEAFLFGRDGEELRIVKGAFGAVSAVAKTPVEARHAVDALAERGHRVIAVAEGPPTALRVVGLIALSDPPREDSAALIAELRKLGVRTVMVTGDSPATAAAVARHVGLAGAVCPPERLADEASVDEFGVFARIVPEDKYRLVKALQRHGHVVGMCGDGANDGPALRQAQIGIAVMSATDIAKAAAGMILTVPGLSGIVFAVREGRAAFQRLLTYTLTMLVKKTEIVLFLAIGLALTGHAVMTPALMVLMFMTNDVLSMSLATDRASPEPAPSVWRMRGVVAAGLTLGAFKLGFSTSVVAVGTFGLRVSPEQLQTLAFVALVLGNQALLYALRERRSMWRSWPGPWVLASSAADIAIVSALALSGIMMEPLPWRLFASVFAAAIGFALVLDRVKRPIISATRLG